MSPSGSSNSSTFEWDTSSGPKPLPVQFHGEAGGFFRVRVVNLLLTIVTLGVWSAWAKVRTNQWFLRHTVVNGHAFDYHATGLQIFKGRLMALIAIAAYSALVWLWPSLEWAAFIALMLALPWAINAGLSFNAAMTSWSNVRFGFRGRYGGAALVFLIMPIVAVFSCGLLAPLCSRMSARYLASGYGYGNLAFATEPRLSALYAALGRSVLVFIATVIMGIGVAFLTGLFPPGAMADIHSHLDPVNLILNFWWVILSGYIALFVAGLYYGASVHNEILNGTTITGGHRLESRLSPLRYVWIIVSGLLVASATLTLAYPWARVRQYRYLMQNITLLAAPGLDEAVSNQQNAPGSFGGEFSELEGFASAALY